MRTYQELGYRRGELLLFRVCLAIEVAWLLTSLVLGHRPPRWSGVALLPACVLLIAIPWRVRSRRRSRGRR